MKQISLSIPGYNINPPAGVPTGGLELGGGGSNALQLGIELIFVVGIVLTVAFTIFSGIQWIISGGDKEKVQKARARLTYSIIGLLIIVVAFFIVGTIITLFGGSPTFFLPTP